MEIAAFSEIVEEARDSLSRSISVYWPVNGNNELGERNQTMHLASAFLRRDWHCWTEVHWDEATDQRLDLLAWHALTRTLCAVEAKRLYSPQGVASIAEDVGRIASFCPIAHGGTGGLVPERCFGMVTATTWSQEIAAWWTSKPGCDDPWRKGTAAWPDARNRAIRAANAGVWESIELTTAPDHGDTKEPRHRLLYAIWPLPGFAT